MKKSIVVMGGGTGTHTVLQGLKRYKQKADLTAIVTMADSGGSTGRLRDEFGYLPVGDVRMALAALARDDDAHDELIRKLFLHRFDKGGGIAGHNFGNLFLVALTDLLGSEEEAILAASRVLRVRGTVLPVTTKQVQLVATYEDGLVVTGEHDIDVPLKERSGYHITKLEITPVAEIHPRAEEAILNADLLVLGPGDLYTSILANCVIDGVAAAIRRSPATLVYVSNLMTKAGQTQNMGVEEHVNELTRYINRRPDVVIANNSPLPDELLERYRNENEYPVLLNSKEGDYKLIVGDFVAKEEVVTASGDVLRRSLIRHDPRKLAGALIDLL